MANQDFIATSVANFKTELTRITSALEAATKSRKAASDAEKSLKAERRSVEGALKSLTRAKPGPKKKKTPAVEAAAPANGSGDTAILTDEDEAKANRAGARA